MAKVEMSLQEYDQIKEKLSFYEEVIDALTNPHTDNWSIQYYKDNPSSTLTVESSTMEITPAKVQIFLKRTINEKIKKWMEANGIEGNYEPNDYWRIHLGTLHHCPEPDPES